MGYIGHTRLTPSNVVPYILYPTSNRVLLKISRNVPINTISCSCLFIVVGVLKI